jgi:hypothetical protein
VVELDYVVQVLISTPEPDPESLTEEYDELQVAYLVPHYRLNPLPFSTPAPKCEWVQCVHPMKEAWARLPHEDVTYGQRPEPSDYLRTVEGRQEINKEWPDVPA